MLFCVIMCVLHGLLRPALGNEFDYGFYHPLQSTPHSWQKWDTPYYHDGPRADQINSNGHIQHPFGFFGAQRARNSERQQNDFQQSGRLLSKHSASLDRDEDDGYIKFIETGVTSMDTPFSQLDTELPFDTEGTEADSSEETDDVGGELNDSFRNIDDGTHFKALDYNDDNCTVGDDEPGTCVNIESCPKMVELLKERPRKQSTINYLNSIRCGFDGLNSKICCPTRKADRTGGPATLWAEPPDVTAHRNLPLLPADCGQFENPRILGGQKADLFEFPWMVLIAYKSDHGIKLSCGGTLISSRYVLTAAHCVTNLQLTKLKLTLYGVVLGDLDTHTDPDCENVDGDTICAPSAQNVTIEEVISHPDYNTKLHNDIALLRLREPADFQQDNIRPICLPLDKHFQNLNLTGLNITVLGWGATETGMQSNHLLRLALPFVSNQDCANVYKSAAEIWYKQICAGGERDRDSCGGDSGGPLQYPGLLKRQIRYVQHGIVSFGHRRCGNGGFPGVYTRIAYYVDWILDNIRP